MAEAGCAVARGTVSPMRRSFFAALAVLGVLAATLLLLWLSLSSGGHGVVGDAADGATFVVGRVEDQLDRDLVSRSDVPWAADELAHMLGWGAITVAAGFAFRSARQLSDIAVGVFAVSIGVELAQEVFTSSRTAQVHDVSANGLGVMLALMFLVAAERLLPPRRPLTQEVRGVDRRRASQQRTRRAPDPKAPQRVR
jgi:VanZ family protein